MINITAAATTDVDLMAVAYLIIKATRGPIGAAAVSAAAAAATSLNREEINLSGRGQRTAWANRRLRHLIRTHLLPDWRISSFSQMHGQESAG